MRGETTNQIALIALATVSTLFFGVFLYRELFPEYKTYQKAYVELENFRSTYTHVAPPIFKFGVKQIVIAKENKGPETIDRCISCHVALTFQHFSPTAIERNVNGEIVYDERGFPKKSENPYFIWKKVQEAKALPAIDTERMHKVLAMHPLIGGETRPFEYHAMEEFGCTICHGGNGRGLATDRAHGAVFDEAYEESFEGPVPDFLETDMEHDPLFSKEYNHKPGHRLLFQTTPLLVGNLIESRCVLCHKPTERFLRDVESGVEELTGKKEKREKLLQIAFEQEYNALITLLSMRNYLLTHGVSEMTTHLKEEAAKLEHTPEEKLHAESQYNYLGNLVVLNEGNVKAEERVLHKIDADLLELLGTKSSLEAFQEAFTKNPDMSLDLASELLQKSSGTLRKKINFLHPKREAKLQTVDLLTKHFTEGEALYISQSCYACHKIAGFARGGVGPELTLEGLQPPWFIKQSIVWPQADLKTSTMPNFKLDHPEVESLMTFLLAQRNDVQALSPIEKKVAIKEWEEGKKRSWEEPLSAASIEDVKSSQIIFASEGCAACHRLQGYSAAIGFTSTGEKLDEDRGWFKRLFPEESLGSHIVQSIDTHREEIQKRIGRVNKNSILEELEENHPGLIESFYSNFAFAARAKEEPQWKGLVRQVLLVYIQEYGLGRLICPRPNWSGTYRSDQWLLEHFWNPQSLVARSIMPVFPFDKSKFLALIHMLNELAPKNRDLLQEVWRRRGFNPENAYQQLCSQCHGEHQKGNGPVAEWIYPPPKNLSNPTFLRNLTKERAIHSITHGVTGTPMPPWGEVGDGKEGKPVLTAEEIQLLVDWLFGNLAGESFLRPEEKEVKKWEFTPEDVLRELQKSGEKLEPVQEKEKLETLHASLTPVVYTSGETIETLFDVIANPPQSPDANSYYIKKKYYTPENLAAGKALFELNCASCHGKDADGSGERAVIMQDAKPRMLINLPWINSRDDLRLFRSITFGVPGTSMTPWGDQTTALQRLQLVLYIRSLTEPQKEIANLRDRLYKAYEPSFAALLEAKAESSRELVATKDSLAKIRLKIDVREGDLQPLFAKEVELTKKEGELELVSALFTKMSDTLKSENDLYQTVGKNLFALYDNSPPFKTFLTLIELNEGRFTWNEQKLLYTPPNKEQVEALSKEIVQAIDKSAPENEERKKKIEHSKAEFIATLSQIRELQHEQQLAYKTWQMQK